MKTVKEFLKEEQLNEELGTIALAFVVGMVASKVVPTILKKVGTFGKWLVSNKKEWEYNKKLKDVIDRISNEKEIQDWFSDKNNITDYFKRPKKSKMEEFGKLIKKYTNDGEFTQVKNITRELSNSYRDHLIKLSKTK